MATTPRRQLLSEFSQTVARTLRLLEEHGYCRERATKALLRNVQVYCGYTATTDDDTQTQVVCSTSGMTLAQAQCAQAVMSAVLSKEEKDKTNIEVVLRGLIRHLATAAWPETLAMSREPPTANTTTTTTKPMIAPSRITKRPRKVVESYKKDNKTETKPQTNRPRSDSEDAVSAKFNSSTATTKPTKRPRTNSELIGSTAKKSRRSSAK